MRTSLCLAGALALLFSGSGRCDPSHAFNAADFQVPADELDAASIAEAAVHTGFLPVPDSDARLVAARGTAEPISEIWELPSHKIASISLTKQRNGKFVVLFVSKEPSKHNLPLSGEACQKWLRFSAAMRTEFARQPLKFKFRNPQCEP